MENRSSLLHITYHDVAIIPELLPIMLPLHMLMTSASLHDHESLLVGP